MGVIFDHNKYKNLLKSEEIDILVWGCKRFPSNKIQKCIVGFIKIKNLYQIFQLRKI